MNIIMFSEVFLPHINGAVTHIELLRKQLTDMGHKVYVVTVSDVNDVTVDDYIIRCPGRRLESIYDYKLGSPISRKRNHVIADLKPDIFHIHNEYSLGYSAIRLSRTLNVPLIYTLHSDYNKYLFYVSKPFYEQALQKLSLKYLNYVARKADIVISPSPKAQTYLNEQRLDKSVRILPNAVETTPFDEALSDSTIRATERKKLNLPHDCLALCFVGRLGKEKSVAELIDTFLDANVSAADARLFLIGQGPEQDKLIQQVCDRKADDRVFLLGKFANTEVATKLAAMDYYATASVSEMHSISFLEATAAGLPGLIKRDEPNSWQVDDNENGWIWDDKADFADRLHKLINANPEERAGQKQRARSHAAAHGVDKQARALLEIYEESLRIKDSRNK